MDDWFEVVDCQMNANKALRRLLDKGAHDVRHLEQSEVHLEATTDKFAEFKELVMKIHERANVLRSRSQQELNEHHQTIGQLKSQIRDLEVSIETQDNENSGLENQLKENVKRLKKKRW